MRLLMLSGKGIRMSKLYKNTLKGLLELIGEPPEGSHVDEWEPRAKTWHEERLNWIEEVEFLSKRLKEEGDKPK